MMPCAAAGACCRFRLIGAYRGDASGAHTPYAAGPAWQGSAREGRGIVPSSVRLHQILLGAAMLVPAVLFAAAAWENHIAVWREGAAIVQRTSAIMHEHARKVFETEELLLSLVDERISDMPPAAVSAPATSDFLRRVKAPLDQAVSAWIADADGTIQAGSQPWEGGAGIGPRDFFQQQRAADPSIQEGGTYISEAFSGKATGAPSFAISRRRTGPNGVFAGTIHVAASPAYFARFYQQAAPLLSHLALLIRSDGAILAQQPGAVSGRLAPSGFLMQQIIEQPAGGAFEGHLTLDGIDRLYSYRKVDAYPVYVVFGLDRKAMVRRWHDNVLMYGLFAATAAATLLGVSWLALRGAKAEQAALQDLRRESAQRLAAEDQLRHVQRMDAVGQLTGGVAHDFNNLLTVILGNLELIERAATHLPNAPPAAAQAAAKITRLAGAAMKGVQRGAQLTRSLLAFARRQPLQPSVLNVNPLLADFAGLVRQAVGAPVAVTFDPSPGLPACRTDPAQLEAAVLNLAINARDAMPDGGRLRISTGTADLDCAALAGNPEAQPGRFVTVCVADTGAGMAPEVVEKAFEPFFTTKPIGQGTGLGLSQVFGFARQSGGHVTLHSTPGAGTAITIYLPLDAPLELDA